MKVYVILDCPAYTESHVLGVAASLQAAKDYAVSLGQTGEWTPATPSASQFVNATMALYSSSAKEFVIEEHELRP